MRDSQGNLPKPEHGWTCFHCGETFTTVGSAEDHFGPTPRSEPGCIIKVKLGEERGLQMELRKVETERNRLLDLVRLCQIVSRKGCEFGMRRVARRRIASIVNATPDPAAKEPRK